MRSPLAIETRKLSRHFGPTAAAVDLDLAVPRGCVYGFLGPNGAGKSTTIRMLLGLLRPTSGDILIDGEVFTRDRRELLRGVGALVEAPSVYPHLTGRENLEVVRRYLGAGLARAEEALTLFDLAKDANRRVRDYSTGMRQLLGLAMAWLAHDRLLILDEPANGLDPVGTRKLRLLLRQAADAGATVLVSSHILSEVDHIADRIGIICAGHLVFQGDLTALKKTPTQSLEDAFLERIASAGAR
jgi:ABC-type multidrug transport system ATPase subunit